ncbi:MAG: 50S ribosome-binding GTPase [Eubacterium sp.]|nr:50S ribosome-binding GTPase [Eubacterium sp.]
MDTQQPATQQPTSIYTEEHPFIPNVVVIGNSGVGKTTLIRTLLADQDFQTEITKELRLYDSRSLGFRLIDTIGFEYGYINQVKAVNAIKKWSKDSIKTNDLNRQINMIWYCIDGTSKRFAKRNVDMFIKSTSVWKSVPIIVVITKSYSKIEREENVRMVQEAFANNAKTDMNLKAIIPVVASTYQIDENVNVVPYGLDDLLMATSFYLPEGKTAAQHDIGRFKLNQKRMMSHSLVGASTLAAATIGLSPIPFSDGALLTPLEIGEIKSLSKMYEMQFDEKSNLFQTIIEAGAAGVIGKTALSVLNTIPGINLAAEVLNAIVAGTIVAALGEGCIYVFEKIYLGEKSPDDIEWVKKSMESEVLKKLMSRLNPILTEIQTKSATKKLSTKDIVMIILKNIR